MLRKYHGSLDQIEDLFEDVCCNPDTLSIFINKEYSKKFKDVLDYQYWQTYAYKRLEEDRCKKKIK